MDVNQPFLWSGADTPFLGIATRAESLTLALKLDLPRGWASGECFLLQLGA